MNSVYVVTANHSWSEEYDSRMLFYLSIEDLDLVQEMNTKARKFNDQIREARKDKNNDSRESYYFITDKARDAIGDPGWEFCTSYTIEEVKPRG